MGLQTSAQARYAFVRRLVADRLPVGSRLVEFGAAPGDQCVALAEAGYRVTAVDLGLSSDAWADAPEGRMVDLFERHGVDYVEWDLERTPYPLAGAAYDGVIFTEVFEHLRDYPVRALEEAARVLRPGGFLFFTTPNAGYLVNRVINRDLLQENIPAYLRNRIEMQAHSLDLIDRTFGNSVLSRVPEFDSEIKGLESIRKLSEVMFEEILS